MTSRPLLRDVAGELQAVMKADSIADVETAALPLLRICADQIGLETAQISDAVSTLITSALRKIEPPDSEALSHLFLGEDRWEALARRGAAAATALGITYDGLRRRDKGGHRRLDGLVEQLAAALLSEIPLERLLSEPGELPPAADPGADAFERASIFLSYARADDQHENNFVGALRESLISEFRFQTGQELVVLQDKTNIDLGENWRRKLESLIDTTSFLLVLLTPSYLRSAACREELTRFLEREQSLGRDDLVLPIYYATVREDSDDELIRTLLTRQYIDWRGLRFEEFTARPVRMAVATLASSIAAALARTAQRQSPSIRETLTNEPGLVERFAAMELALPRFLRSMLSLGEEQDGINQEVTQATADVERHSRAGRGGTARLIVARQLAARLEPYAIRMEEAAQSIRADLATIGNGMESMAAELPDSDEQGLEEVVRGMIEAIRSTLDAAREASASIEAMAETYGGVARTTSAMRPILTRLVASARVVSECPETFQSWVEQLESGLATRALAHGS